MPTYTQSNRTLSIKTPIGPDELLLVGFRGSDAVSQLFCYRLDLIALNEKTIAFDALLGQSCTVTLRWGLDNKKETHLNGICSRISQGRRDPVFTRYHMELVPKAWLLTRKAQSRIFQRLSVPDILKKVLQGLPVNYEIEGTFHPRDFCVQYRETDFNFACRLMEEEGIHYFFKHEDGNHTMVVGNRPSASHPPAPTQDTVPFEEQFGGQRAELRISGWEKVQELRSGKYTLWDHSFELPHKHLEADKLIQDSVSVGSVTHKLKVANNDKLEIYDFPGEYAQRFDGVNKGGGDQPAELQKIFEDNKRTVEIRMQEETFPSLEIGGKSDCRQFVSGHQFTLQRHFNADGAYLLTSVDHVVSQTSADYLAGEGQTTYLNTFTCVPVALVYRPARTTLKPVVQGSQSAVVVGPKGEEIFTDKYGRVKVQFHWDREGKNDEESSCWIRVATNWAGKRWGMVNIPRIGQEVLVDFLEGDPDQPVIVGSLYNADMMPPYTLPANKTQSGVQSRSSLGGSPENFNEIKFEDKKGHELLKIHAERNQSISVEASESHTVGYDRTKDIGHDETSTIHNNRNELVYADETIGIFGMRTETVGKNQAISIAGMQFEIIGEDELHMVMQNRITGITTDDTLSVGGSLRIFAADMLLLDCGASSLTLKKDGTIELKGTNVDVLASEGVKVVGTDEAVLNSDQGTTYVLGNDISVNSGGKLDAFGASAKLSGGDVEVSAISNLSLKGNASAKLEADGNLEVTSMGITQIKGSMVKVN